MPSLSLFANNNSAFEQVKRSMQEIGYQGDLLAENYEYADIIGKYKVNKVEMAGFASVPLSYRNACIGIVRANGLTSKALVNKHRSLGAPLFFVLNADSLETWKVKEKGEPERKEVVTHEQITRLFEENANHWKPDRIFRAKVIGEIETVSQLDFFDLGLMPLLEGMIHKKLDRLLGEALKEIKEAYQIYVQSEPDFKELYRLVFRFIVAKVMQDRKHIDNFNDANQILEYIEQYYSLPTEVLTQVRNREKIVEVAWKAISGQFHFQNLSVDDLAFIYENSFVTEDNRDIFETHSTPPRVAEYIIQKLPFLEVPESDRYVLEPCSGHGAFLVPALRRLRELLPSTTSIEERHKYLTRRLTGIEIDSFAIEACWSRLVLADYPHPNGWELKERDVFEGDILATELKKARILFCNPPFGDFTTEQREYYLKSNKILLPQKPVEILRRIMQHPPNLLGLVLPRRFESNPSYLPFHKLLAETYDLVELVALPEIFNYSEATTMIVLASGKREHYGSVTVFSRRVEDTEKKSFLNGVEPPAAKATFAVEDYLQPDFSLWVAPLSRVWDYLKNAPRLESIGQVHRGIEWKGREDKETRERKEISDYPKNGYMKGYPKVAGHFEQYLLKHPKYLSLRKEDQRIDAYKRAWHKPKVVCNTARIGRKAWRLGAVADNEGLAFNQKFFGIWLNENFSIYAVAALLNSPLANAFMFSQEGGRDNHARTIESLPLPPLLSLSEGGKIGQLSKELHQQIKWSQFEKAKATILQVDAEILKEYDLPPYLERELLNIFQDVPRPVPFEFNGYYPDGFKAYFPLHEIISEEFELSRADKLMERLPMIGDKELAAYLDEFFAENDDESGIS